MNHLHSKRVHVASWAIALVFAATASLLFLLFFSYNTSPLSSSYGYDAAFFQLVGSGLLDGYLPYRDFFDMKGPYLFFFEAVGQLIIRGRLGAFILQWASLFVSLALLFKTVKLVGRQWWVPWGIAVSLICLFPLSSTLEGGNLTEELSLPFTFAILSIVFEFFIEYEKGCVRFESKSAILCGVIVGIIFLIRITNAAFILALLLSVAILMMGAAEARQLLRAIAYALLGFIIAFVPPCLFFWANGCLGEMWYCVFQFGLTYSGEVPFAEKMAMLFNGKLGITLTMLLAPLIATVLVNPKTPWCWAVSVLCPIATGLAMAMGGKEYLHYSTLAIPSLALGCFIALYVPKEPKRTQWINVVAIVVIAATVAIPQYERFDLSYQLSKQEIEYHFRTSSDDPSQPLVSDIANRIPASDRDSVFCYGNGQAWSRWYCMARLYPCMRYMDWQDHYLELEPQMEPELMSAFSELPPKWLIVPSGEDALPSFLEDIVHRQYVLEYENERYDLYHVIATGD